MTGSIRSIFHSFAFFQKKTPKRISKKAKAKDYYALAKSISIPVEKRFLLVAEKGLDQIILTYVPTVNSQEQRKIHKLIIKNFTSGHRAKSLGEKLSEDFLIEHEIAKKIAQHSLSFLSAKYRQARFQDIGVTHYKWNAVMDSRTQPLHRELNGKIFSWDSPPIADQETGDRYNPGEFPGCRCISIPVLE